MYQGLPKDVSGWIKVIKSMKGMKESWQGGRSQIIEGCVGLGKELGFHSKYKGKSHGRFS